MLLITYLEQAEVFMQIAQICYICLQLGRSPAQVRSLGLMHSPRLETGFFTGIKGYSPVLAQKTSFLSPRRRIMTVYQGFEIASRPSQWQK